MNRRQFGMAAVLALAGCNRSAAVRQEQRANADAKRAERLAALAPFRVANTATRTTPKPVIDPLTLFPDLKPLMRVTLRLHPRFGDEPSPNATKLGGQFLWPSEESWPLDPDFRLPMVPVLQLRAEDALPQVPFKPNTDLLQLFWSPRPTKSGTPNVTITWRKRTAVGSSLTEFSHEDVPVSLLPVPCRVLPERVMELPPMALMPNAMRTTIEGWTPPVDYHAQLAAARGTKIGGWPRTAESVRCASCVRPMDYLLTIDSREWTPADAARWKPTEDVDAEGSRRALGIEFSKPDAAAMVFICQRCEKWPVRAMVT